MDGVCIRSELTPVWQLRTCRFGRGSTGASEGQRALSALRALCRVLSTVWRAPRRHPKANGNPDWSRVKAYPKRYSEASPAAGRIPPGPVISSACSQSANPANCIPAAMGLAPPAPWVGADPGSVIGRGWGCMSQSAGAQAIHGSMDPWIRRLQAAPRPGPLAAEAVFGANSISPLCLASFLFSANRGR